MHVILVEPAFPQNQREFARALHSVGAKLTGIGERPVEYLDDELRGWLDRYEQVGSVVNEQALLEAVQRCQRREWVDRLEATIEAHILPTARVREACGIPGTSVETSFLCRDKPAMKEALRRAGIPCAQSAGVSSPAEAQAFAQQVGFPVILKPRDAAGAAGTYRADNAAELDRALAECGVDRDASAAVEEFIEGHEGFYDTVSVDGEVVHEFVSHYYPNVLEGMRQRWISPQFIATNRLNAPGYEEVRRMAKQVIDALGIRTPFATRTTPPQSRPSSGVAPGSALARSASLTAVSFFSTRSRPLRRRPWMLCARRSRTARSGSRGPAGPFATRRVRYWWPRAIPARVGSRATPSGRVVAARHGSRHIARASRARFSIESV